MRALPTDDLPRRDISRDGPDLGRSLGTDMIPPDRMTTVLAEDRTTPAPGGEPIVPHSAQWQPRCRRAVAGIAGHPQAHICLPRYGKCFMDHGAMSAKKDESPRPALAAGFTAGLLTAFRAHAMAAVEIARARGVAVVGIDKSGHRVVTPVEPSKQRQLLSQD